ncbi:LysR substrate-binding domain-containing protein [Plastoroseomonas arctica]|uniref:LysR family transcriptional regulator n=1 Tax=Plastoroseomonas arctica TaxID=1509237 RepID=A0AAF1JWN5_9PROT|nr:LysR substrate-binding domain-containing protein [Plastoroseomonas arctica]MBR0655501.1 LysR family transcriptional regulator [Plastoroseomonas arctica]
MRRLTLRQIEAFRAVMLRGSISGAGEMLGLTQPAVSRLMRDMQEVLNLKLFLRRGNSIAASAEATLLFEEVQRSFVSLHRIERTAQEIKRAWHGSLRIAAMAGPAYGFLPGLVAQFLREHPDTFVALHNHITTTTLERVSLRQFDIGMAYAPPDYPGLEIERLPLLEAVCALPADHPLAAKGEITLEDLRGQNLLSLGTGSQIAMRLDAMLRLAGILAPVLAESTASEVLCRLVGQGVGIALVDPFTGAAVRDPAVVVRRFAPRVEYGVALVFPSGVPRSPAVTWFAEAVRNGSTMARLLPA